MVATTRPETMLGDAAVAVHPEDERYKNLIGRHVMLPLVNRLIPIVADDYADLEFGTGCVKITPAHDFNDYEVGKRHQLPLINIFDQNACVLARAQVFNIDGTVNDKIDGSSPDGYAHMDRFDARKAIVAEFEAMSLLEKIDDHALKVPRGDRSGTIIEPWLTDQWYVSTKPLAEGHRRRGKRRDPVRAQAVREHVFQLDARHPDWCISRQLWWGHRIPARTTKPATSMLAATKWRYAASTTSATTSSCVRMRMCWTPGSAPACGPSPPSAGRSRPSSSRPSTPPTLVTGFDIIFFWVARMIMLSTHLTGQIPFKTVYVHGLVRDGQGQKMSKSKGNVLDPLDIVDGITLDELLTKRTSGMMQPSWPRRSPSRPAPNSRRHRQLRHRRPALHLLFLASTGRDIKFDMGRVEGYRNFCNKIWNAANFVFENTEGKDTGVNGEPVELSSVDRWIISALQRTEAEVTRQLEAFRFDCRPGSLRVHLGRVLRPYLELVKPLLWDETASVERQRGTRRTLVRVLETALRPPTRSCRSSPRKSGSASRRWPASPGRR